MGKITGKSAEVESGRQFCEVIFAQALKQQLSKTKLGVIHYWLVS